MRKNPEQYMYNKFSIKDAIIVIISLIALAALIFIIKSSNDRVRMEQELFAETGAVSKDSQSESSSSKLIEALTLNEINQAGWIELYNKSEKAEIELTNCYITVNGEKKYIFTNKVVIGAGNYLCIEGLGQLGRTGRDIIGIFDKNGEKLKNIIVPRLESKESYGCRTDGDISYFYLSASKEKTNRESNIIRKNKLAFSVPGGFYDESFLLEIVAPEESVIYYTLDGTEPTVQSEVYTEPILIENKSGSNIQYATAEGIDYLNSYRPVSISMGMVVRAIAVNKKGLSSEIESQSYFVGIKKASDIKNMPVLSIITAPENLFDYFEGIYVSGRSKEDAIARGEDGGAAANYLNGWEKEVHIEYFEPQKDKTFEGIMSLSILKDFSVTLPQKSLLLTAKGSASSGSSLENYYNEISNRLVVQTNRRDNNYKIREYLAGKLLANTSIGTPDIMPCIVFINGEYWGGYMLSAEYDARYIKRHYGVDEEKVLIAQNGKVINNPNHQQELEDLYLFIKNNDLKEADNYEWVKEHMDIQNYLEFLCANMYLANAEYGLDDLVMWKTMKEQGTGYEDGRWRFLMPRLDNSMNNGEAGEVATSSINTYLQAGVMEDFFLQSLLRNDEFKKQFSTVMTDMADHIFTSENANTEIALINDQMKRMVEISYKRFVGNVVDKFYTKEVEKIKSFFENRKKYILVYTEEVISLGGNRNVDDAVSE